MFSLLQLILSLPQVEACVVVLHESLRLLAFVVASTSGDQRAASPLTSAEHSASAVHGERLQHQEQPGGADGDLSRLILNQLSLLLPSYSVPDALLLVPALCLTPHGEHHTVTAEERRQHISVNPSVCFMAGKVDMEALVKMYQRQRRCLESSRGDVTRLKQTLQKMWQVRPVRCF